MQSKYIKDLLAIHNRVIIPDLGAFMLKPENSSIYFNEFLRFNDGLLVNYISEQEKIEKPEGAKKVKAFVDEINKHLHDKRTVDLEGLGVLFIDATEKIQFKDPTSSETPAQVHIIPPAPEEKIIESQKEVKASEAAPEINKPEIKEVVPEKKPPVKKVKPVKPSYQVSPTNNTMKTKSKAIAFIAAAAVIAIAAVFYFVFFNEPGKNNLSQNITIGNDSTTGTSIQPTENFAENQTDVKTTPSKKETKQNNLADNTSNSKKYCLVAGSFTVEDNAVRMVSNLKKNGYNAEKFFNDKNNRYYVSIAYFDKLSIATREMNRIKNNDNTITWIYQMF